MTTRMKKVCIASLMVLCLSACSEQKAQPYEEMNQSTVNTQKQGFIQTH